MQTVIFLPAMYQHSVRLGMKIIVKMNNKCMELNTNCYLFQQYFHLGVKTLFSKLTLHWAATSVARTCLTASFLYIELLNFSGARFNFLQPALINSLWLQPTFINMVPPTNSRLILINLVARHTRKKKRTRTKLKKNI